MSNTANFNRTYTDFGSEVRDFEKTTSLSIVVAEFMCKWSYPFNAMMGAEFSAQWLRDGERGPNDPADLDLIYRMEETEISGLYYEIVLRDANELPFYGGWLIGGGAVELTDEIVNGYRVLIVHRDDGPVRHEYDPSEGYVPVAGSGGVAATIIDRRTHRRAA